MEIRRDGDMLGGAVGSLVGCNEATHTHTHTRNGRVGKGERTPPHFPVPSAYIPYRD